MDQQVPLDRARIEWNRDGVFRISNFDSDPCDRSLKNSGGACFARWTEVSRETRELWLLWHGLFAMHDGCDPEQVLDELNLVPEFFDIATKLTVSQQAMRSAGLCRGKEAKDGEAASE